MNPVSPIEDDNLARLRRIDTCALSDALDKLRLPGVVMGLVQRSGSGRIAGLAVTMKVGVGQPAPGPAKHLGCSAIEQSSSANIIVVEQRSGIDAGCWGGLLTLGAKVFTRTATVLSVLAPSALVLPAASVTSTSLQSTSSTRPALMALYSLSAAVVYAIPPVWKVRMVS